jgi:hypothetical protein
MWRSSWGDKRVFRWKSGMAADISRRMRVNLGGFWSGNFDGALTVDAFLIAPAGEVSASALTTQRESELP